jgi:hypothetical protein
MHWAAFANERCAKPAQHALGLHQNAPKALGEILVIRCVDMVLTERDGVWNLIWQLVDGHFDADIRERVQKVGIEIRNRARNEPYLSLCSVARRRKQHMIQKIKIELEGAVAVGNG